MGYVYGGLKQAGDAREDSETFKEFKPEIAISIYWERKNAGLYIKDLEMMWKIVSHIFLNEKSEPKLKRQLEPEIRDGLEVAVPYILRQMAMAVSPNVNAQEALLCEAEAKIKRLYEPTDWSIAGFLSFFQRIIKPLAPLPRDKWEARIMHIVAMQLGLAPRVATDHRSRDIPELYRILLSESYKRLK